ncbi:hypothetical protein BJX65DRAFT_29019 [Aspergillus insuetus]
MRLLQGLHRPSKGKQSDILGPASHFQLDKVYLLRLESPVSPDVVVMLEYGEPIVEDVLSHHAMCGHSTAPINRHMSVEMTCRARAARSLSPPGVMSALFGTPIWHQVLLMSGARLIAGCLLDGGRPYGVPSPRAMGQTGDRRQVFPGKSKKKDEFQKTERNGWR